jgi:TP901 family phage tail tape measure protein
MAKRKVANKEVEAALRRVGATANDCGVSLAALQDLIIRAQETTGRSGVVIGNALKTVFTRLQRPDVQAQMAELLGGVFQMNIVRALVVNMIHNPLR